MLVTLEGITISTRPVQLEKAFLPIEVTLLWSTTRLILPFCLKAASPIAVISGGMITSSLLPVYSFNVPPDYLKVMR
jgi:hypothetical protein